MHLSCLCDTVHVLKLQIQQMPLLMHMFWILLDISMFLANLSSTCVQCLVSGLLSHAAMIVPAVIMPAIIIPVNVWRGFIMVGLPCWLLGL